MVISFSQNPLVVLKTKSVAIQFQQVVVQWLIAMFGMDYVSEATPDLLRQMIAAIVQKENIKGLSATYDSLAERYPLTVDAVAEAAKYAAGKLFFLYCNASCEYFDHICTEQAMRHHHIVVHNALVALLVAPRTTVTVAENKVVHAVFGKGTLQPVLRLRAVGGSSNKSKQDLHLGDQGAACGRVSHGCRGQYIGCM
jgi:hypothetical protein